MIVVEISRCDFLLNGGKTVQLSELFNQALVRSIIRQCIMLEKE